MRKSRGDKSGGLVTVIDVIVYFVSMGIAIALIMAYLAPYVDPNTTIFFALLGLAAPMLYIAMVLFTLYWIIRWRPISLAFIIVLLIGINNVGKYFRPQLSKVYEVAREDNTIRILSYNIRGFYGGDDAKFENVTDDITDYIKKVNPDIICFQEFEVGNESNRFLLDKQLADWKYRFESFVVGDSRYGWGLATYSKYPIISRLQINYPESNSISTRVKLLVNRDTVDVYNNHLQTTELDNKDKQFITENRQIDSDSKVKITRILRKLKRNYQKRALQADSIASYVSQSSMAIVCGDFNDTPMSYTYYRMRGDLDDAFKNKGKGVVSTYKGLFGLLRIDYIFHTDDFETISYATQESRWSDHIPVIVDLKKKNNIKK